MSKDLFLMMREQEVNTDNFLPTKKELIQSTNNFAKDLINSGEHDMTELYSQAVRLKEAFNILEANLKKELPQEGFEAYGIKATFRNGGETLNFSEDELYAELEAKLKKRKEQLTLVYKQGEEMTIDGIYTPLVSSTPRKSSLSISF